MKLARNLKKIRNKKKLSQRKLAELTGLSDAYVNQLETGAKANPSMITVSIIAHALGVPMADLMK